MLRITLVSMLVLAGAPAVLAQQGKTTAGNRTTTSVTTQSTPPSAPTFDYVVGSPTNRPAGASVADTIFTKAVGSLGTDAVDPSIRLTEKQTQAIQSIQTKHREATAAYLTKNQKQITTLLTTLGFKADFSTVSANPERVMAEVHRAIEMSRKPAYTPAQAMAAISHEPARREALRNLRVLVSKAPSATQNRTQIASVLTGDQKQWLTSSLRERVAGRTARVQGAQPTTQRGGKSAGAKDRD